MTLKHEVRVKYSLDLWPAFDETIRANVGRHSDYSGAGFGERDHGWVCDSEIEAAGIARSLRHIGLTPETVQREHDDSPCPSTWHAADCAIRKMAAYDPAACTCNPTHH